jgi:hypothetical protein
MKFWASFADTLNTRGGTIAALCVATLVLGIGLIVIMVKGYSNQPATVIVSTFSSFTGALLLALTQKDRVNGNGAPPPSTPTNTALGGPWK